MTENSAGKATTNVVPQLRNQQVVFREKNGLTGSNQLELGKFYLDWIIYACSHAGLVEKVKFYLDLMKEYGVESGDQHYASMVDIYGRANKLQEALAVIKEMPMQPTECVCGALLTGCRLHRNTELAAYATDKIFELGPVGSGLHVLLSNVYAAAGRYEDAARTRKMLRDIGGKKGNGIKLEDQMVKAGYVADTSYVSREVGSEEKNMAIRYHSERLANAFALITFLDNRPIRTLKNLRICGDCHTAIKFMSKCSGRLEE
ncbi:tetratricopeptide-like helical domain, DYW domain protein [Artemisia annua]|uniref:Tetratricopeptide-like helical domain, DYW domain protein n=1 Tax=Artemisia annua TaxID=35608 RepID=A0A2U1QNT6_ARTAN|nr:tetratricopeptide-like helical domain, DYW domain protein [Artemisia annua]